MKTCLHLSFKALIELIHRLKLSTNKCGYQCEANMVTPTMMEREHIPNHQQSKGINPPFK